MQRISIELRQRVGHFGNDHAEHRLFDLDYRMINVELARCLSQSFRILLGNDQRNVQYLGRRYLKRTKFRLWPFEKNGTRRENDTSSKARTNRLPTSNNNGNVLMASRNRSWISQQRNTALDVDKFCPLIPRSIFTVSRIIDSKISKESFGIANAKSVSRRKSEVLCLEIIFSPRVMEILPGAQTKTNPRNAPFGTKTAESGTKIETRTAFPSGH